MMATPAVDFTVLLSDASRATVEAVVDTFVTKHPVQAAKQLARLDKAVANGVEMDAYDAYRHHQLRVQLVAHQRCTECGRHLEDPESVKRGVGPECWEKVDG